MFTLRHALLVLLLLSQAIFMAAGGSLVLCMEIGSTSQFELLSGDCCEIQGLVEADAEAGGQRLLAGQPGDYSGQSSCGGCEDQGFSIASIGRHECPIPEPGLSPGFWNLAACAEPGLAPAGFELLATQRALGHGRDPGSGHAVLGRGLLIGTVLRC